MRVESKRYALVNGIPTIEVTLWDNAEDVGIPLTDLRLRSLPGYQGLFFASAVVGFLGDLSTFSQYQNSDGSYNIPFDSSYYGVTEVPLKPGVVVVSESQYNAAVAAQQNATAQVVANYEASVAASEQQAAAAQQAAASKLLTLGLTPADIQALTGVVVQEPEVIIGGQG